MARERYLLDEAEEQIHANEINPDTKGDKAKNWWYYHKFIVIGIAIAAVLIISFVYSIISQVKPDYTVAFMSSYAVPDELTEELQEHIAKYCDDRNGDGQIMVSISTYVLNSDSEDSYELQASVTRFIADCSNAESIIFIHDEKSFNYVSQAGFEGFFRYNDGTPMGEATDYENAMISWDKVKGLANFTPSLSNEYATADDYKNLLQKNYRISIRDTGPVIEAKESLIDYYKDNIKLYERLIEDKKLVEG